MAYSYKNSKGQTYYLHGKVVTLQGGRQQQIHYFAREAKPGEAMNALPSGYTVVENPRTGLPFAKHDKTATVAASTPPAPKARAATRTKK